MRLPGGGDRDGVHALMPGCALIPGCAKVTRRDVSISAQQPQSVGESGRAIHSESLRQSELTERASMSQPSDSFVAAGRRLGKTDELVSTIPVQGPADPALSDVPSAHIPPPGKQ